VRDHARPGPQPKEDARSQLQVDLGKQIHRHDGGVVEVGEKDVLLQETDLVRNPFARGVGSAFGDQRGIVIDPEAASPVVLGCP
jgi:hypothetical protein